MSSSDVATQHVRSQARDFIDDILKNRIPGIEEADAKFAPIAQQQVAYDQGRQKVLQTGTEAMTPMEFKAIQARSSGPINAARVQGIRTEIGRMTGTNAANPAPKTERILSDPWNRAKVTSAIGGQRMEQLAKGLDTESTFLETSALGEPARGSRTAILDAASKEMWNTGARPGVIGEAAMSGLAGTAIGGPASGVAAGGATIARNLAARVGTAFTARTRPAIIQSAADLLTVSGGDVPAAIALLNKVAADMPRSRDSAAIKTAIVNALLTMRSSTRQMTPPAMGQPSAQAPVMQ
jgi:hypothetical protein